MNRQHIVSLKRAYIEQWLNGAFDSMLFVDDGMRGTNHVKEGSVSHFAYNDGSTIQNVSTQCKMENGEEEKAIYVKTVGILVSTSVVARHSLVTGA